MTPTTRVDKVISTLRKATDGDVLLAFSIEERTIAVTFIVVSVVKCGMMGELRGYYGPPPCKGNPIEFYSRTVFDDVTLFRDTVFCWWLFTRVKA